MRAQRTAVVREGPRLLNGILLLFWAAWFSLVFASNFADGLREAGLLSETWPFASGNFELVVATIAPYGLSRAWAVALFAAVLLTELGVAVLFWRALLRGGRQPEVDPAFWAGIALFAGFLAADELFVVYHRLQGLEVTHFLVLVALLLSLLVLRQGPTGAGR